MTRAPTESVPFVDDWPDCKWVSDWSATEVWTSDPDGGEGTTETLWVRWYEEAAHCERCKPIRFPMTGGPA